MCAVCSGLRIPEEPLPYSRLDLARIGRTPAPYLPLTRMATARCQVGAGWSFGGDHWRLEEGPYRRVALQQVQPGRADVLGLWT